MSTHKTSHGASQGSVGSYLTGLILSIVLTVIPFWMVMAQTNSKIVLTVSVLIIALVQIAVQVIFFLHLSASSSASWNYVTFWFMIITMVIIVGGSLWVMHHLNHNTMIGY